MVLANLAHANNAETDLGFHPSYTAHYLRAIDI